MLSTVKSFIANSIAPSLNVVESLVVPRLVIHQSSMNRVSTDFLSDNTSRETRIGSNLISLRFPSSKRTRKANSRDVSTIGEWVRWRMAWEDVVDSRCGNRLQTVLQLRL